MRLRATRRLLSRPRSRCDATRPLCSCTQSQDTIFALSSGGLGVRAGVAVIRVSGGASRRVLSHLTTKNGSRTPRFPAPRMATHRTLYGHTSANKKRMLDRALVLWFPQPKSFTGEDVVELHVHGGTAVVSGVLQALESTASILDEPIRPANPGEFTRRAYSNGKLDLLEVEGLADLLAADTERQKLQALAALGGQQSGRILSYRKRLLQALAHVEALIDFGDDEDDVNTEVLGSVRRDVGVLHAELAQQLRHGERGQLVRGGLQVAIVGPPNAGKSSLLNVLADSEVAIVSDTAGTTRDVLKVQLSVGGYSVTVCDTAGLREPGRSTAAGAGAGAGADPGAEAGAGAAAAAGDLDPIEVEGMRRARALLQQAHIHIYVFDAHEIGREMEVHGSASILQQRALEFVQQQQQRGQEQAQTQAQEQEQEHPLEHAAAASKRTLFVLNKQDLLQNGLSSVAGPSAGAGAGAGACVIPDAAGAGTGVWHSLSCVTGAGMGAFMQGLECAVEDAMVGGGGSDAGIGISDNEGGVLITRLRHRHHTQACVEALERFLGALQHHDQSAVNVECDYDSLLDLDLAIVADELRVAAQELGHISGAVDVEELLDVIFNDFCIGK